MLTIAANRKGCAALNWDQAGLRKRGGPTGKGEAPWTLNATVRSHRARDRRTGLPAPSASIRCSTFEPGGRTAWHTHPLGQTLIVMSGVGRVQRQGGPIEEIRPGDVVWFPPGEKHWHGASPTTAMTHIAVQEALNGKVVEWMEQVSDAQYRG
jgi:quercetin dioxygenase-like cupin family protein